MIKENMYGSVNRVKWFTQFLNKRQVIIDIGCGTGFMVTIPMICQGYNVIGIDLDKKSIEYGKNLLKQFDKDENRLLCTDFCKIDINPDVIIMSEVLEHLESSDLENILLAVYKKLRPGGLFLITVPNGYGWFELESFLWYKAKLGWLLEKLYIVEAIIIAKNKLIGNSIAEHPSSLDSSGHIQRFTYNSLEKKLLQYGFKIVNKQGGTLVSGPFSNLFFTGIKPIMAINVFLGRLFSRIASDFYICVRKD